MPDSNKLIVVLGAHRSGTSLCAAALQALGADPCLGEHYANDENQKGFFEHPDIVDFNDRLLAYLGGSWDNPLFQPRPGLDTPELDSWLAEASSLLVEIYGGAEVAVLKDPRICQLLPFWRRAINEAGYASGHVYFVHTLRDPVEVALSQQQRALANPDFYEVGRELGEGAALWLSLTAQVLADDAAPAMCYVDYPGLLTTPAMVLDRLEAFAGLRRNPGLAHAFIEDFVDPALYRSSASAEARAAVAAVLPQALAVHQHLQQAAGGSLAAEEVAACRDIVAQPETQAALATIMIPALSRLSSNSRRDRLALVLRDEMLADTQAQVEELRANEAQLRAEHSQVVEPLRAEVDVLQRGNTELHAQVAAQSEEIGRVTAIAEEIRAAKLHLERQNAELAGQLAALDQARQTLQAQHDVLDERVRGMEASTSWRITRPLRSVSFRARRLRSWSANQWVQFRLKAILTYHRMSLRHPRPAWVIRRMLRPVFRLMNRTLAVTPADVHSPTEAGLLTPMRYQQYEASDGYTPLVSVIVPNYNHADYLRLRLDSIFSQGYGNFEVILLDDASTDASARILQEFHQRYPGQSTLVINEENSGGVFHQWERGLSLARGEIIWIAESDDWCTENFLETLVPFFENEAVQLAYARTVFMDGDGEKQIWSINEYLHDIDPQRWNHPIVETGPAIVREAFAVKNIVPNVSSALFRNPRDLEILADPQWRQMKTCGDWVLYLHLLRGGMLAYSPEACNYYRMHGKNTSVGSYVEDRFYREHEQVALTVQRYFDVPFQAFERLRDNLALHWRETRGEFSDEALEACFSLARIEAAAVAREPNLLMASYAFCAGGGETFPVSLANIMKRHGYNVTYLDCAREPRMEGVRDKLRRDIPIVSDFTQLERIIADFGIDVIHSHHAWVDSTILDILPEEVNCRTVVTLHGMYETINEYDLRPILPRLVKRSAKLIYVADKNLEAIDRHGLLQYARVSRIDNALEPESFEPVSRESLGIDDGAFVLTLVSRGMVEKGWVEAIESVSVAREASGRDIQLLLVGDGPEYERLLQEQLPAFVHLQGFQRNVRGYFAASNLSLIHISEPTRLNSTSRMPSSA